MPFSNQPFLPNLLARLPEPPEKVVVLRASRIGDFICATPSFQALRSALPGAHITIVALPFVRELASRTAFFDNFVEFCGFPGIAEQFFEARKTTNFLARMQAQKFDLALQMHGTGVYSNPFTLLLGAKSTAGFVRDLDQAGRLDAAMPMPARGHEIQRCLAFTAFLGINHSREDPIFPLNRRDHGIADRLLSQAESPLIGIHPFAGDSQKCWPLIRFMKTAHRLREDHGGTIVVIGSADNRMAASAIVDALGGSCLDLTGKTSISVSGAVISRLAVLITNDSAPAHIAYTLRTPTVVIFIDSDPARWGPPQDGPFRVVRSFPDHPTPAVNETTKHRSLAEKSVEEVVRAAESIFPCSSPMSKR